MSAGGKSRPTPRTGRGPGCRPRRASAAALAGRALSWPRARWARLGWRARALLAGGLAVVTAGLIALAVMPSGPAPRARVYLSFTACLLTGPQGVEDPVAAPAWAGLQDASGATKVQVEYLAVPASAHDAAPYLASLVMEHCGLVVAAGAGPVAAVEANADRYKSVRFVTVGGRATSRNITVVPPADARSRVSAEAKAALAAAGS